MKKIKHSAILALTLFIAGFGATAQNVGIGTATPNASAQLDITAVNKGLLIPRVALTSLTDAVTITAPANSLLVYNTNVAIPGGAGFYYNSGNGSAIWVKLLSGAGGGSGWGLTGNAATDSIANFLGTTDLKPLVFRVNNGFAGQISSIGGISLGRAANGTKRIAEPGVIAVGDSALFSNSNNNAIAIGNGALYSNTTGTRNTALGNLSLASNTIGSANVAIGDFSLFSNIDSSFNTAVGYAALSSNVEDQNTAIGAFALTSNDVGYYNSAFGSSALTSNGNGVANTGIGMYALLNNTIGDVNTSTGYASLANNESGSFNSAYGYFSLINDSIGNHNTAYGSYSLRTLISGSFNTAIGDSADVSPIGGAAFFNTTAIGYKAVATGSNTISIGNTSVTAIRGQVGFTTFSDGRYKKDVSENVKGLDFIMQLRPVTYHYDFDKINSERYSTSPLTDLKQNFLNRKAFISSPTQQKGKAPTVQFSSPLVNLNSPKAIFAKKSLSPELTKYYEEVKQNNQIRYTGFIAQEVEAVAKKIGFEFSGVDKPKNDKDQYGLRYADFVVPLVKAVQEQQAIINSQNKKIDDLIKRIETLEAAKQ